MTKTMNEEAMEEEKEASTPGDRGKEEHDAKRGPIPRKHGGGIHGGKHHHKAGPKHHSIHRRRGGAMMEKEEEAAERKKGGVLPMDGAKEHESHEMKRFHHQARKHGGHIKGEKAKERPDRRARGGATSDLRPETAAGKMMLPDYLRQQDRPNGGGRGADSRGTRGRD